MDTGKKLKDLRNSKDLTMDALVEQLNKNYNLNITKSMMSRWENNLSEPSNKFIAAYAKFFNIDLNYLVGITDIKAPLRKENRDNKDNFITFYRVDTRDMTEKEKEEFREEMERYADYIKERFKTKKEKK